ncbi:hypothetical protein Q8791_15535 [Nocardiopsis sp. CT-R113]|uniref:Uncharacterized protein n=1 Tax=Nocardiopsis codii TaxID=3065942 RepID=A0ABU7KAQ8_9ACTN|nr:hypothetical protein [Nocardiopsis sp. CT-R113]MEE2038637.1 hypothetical protein [Nocardiopsis sp. CT-R113]
MTNSTQTTEFITGFAMSSRQLSLTAVSGTAESGLTGVLAGFGEFITTGVGHDAKGGSDEYGTHRSRALSMVSPVVPTGVGNGSGVPANPELALDRGKRTTEHAEATQRLYGASGECPRRIPA